MEPKINILTTELESAKYNSAILTFIIHTVTSLMNINAILKVLTWTPYL